MIAQALAHDSLPWSKSSRGGRYQSLIDMEVWVVHPVSMDRHGVNIYRKARQDSERMPKLELNLHEYIEAAAIKGDPNGALFRSADWHTGSLKAIPSIASMRGRWCSGARRRPGS
jgi:hypothetical protein